MIRQATKNGMEIWVLMFKDEHGPAARVFMSEYGAKIALAKLKAEWARI
jgi:hypothetical protein